MFLAVIGEAFVVMLIIDWMLRAFTQPFVASTGG